MPLFWNASALVGDRSRRKPKVRPKTSAEHQFFWEHLAEKSERVFFNKTLRKSFKKCRNSEICVHLFFASGWCCRKWSGNHTRCLPVRHRRTTWWVVVFISSLSGRRWSHVGSSSNLVQSKIVVVLGLFLPWLAWLIPTLEINKILHCYDSIPDLL